MGTKTNAIINMGLDKECGRGSAKLASAFFRKEKKKTLEVHNYLSSGLNIAKEYIQMDIVIYKCSFTVYVKCSD